ncbi:MAG: autotransporter domain-containing protein [Rhodocyclaceae bacterium]|nr:autotransporter domain-containing protein [Rhodocyclaceae bacterium]
MKQSLRKAVKKSALGLAVGVAVGVMSLGAQAQYSNMYVFGDSLSDPGAWTAYTGSATANLFTNAGQVWNENLAARLGLTLSGYYAINSAAPGGAGDFTTLANVNGNNFAVGGARADLVPGVFTGPSFAGIVNNIPSVSTQVTALLTARPSLDSNAAYFVWAGANDIFTQAAFVGGGGSAAVAATALGTAASATMAQIGRLKAAGAKNIIVLTVPDIGATPYGVSLGGAGAAGLTSLSSTYNNALTSALAGQGVLLFDSNKLLAAIRLDPARFGVTNTTVPACGAASSLGCVLPTNGALFADGVHPSTLGHTLISDWIYSTLNSASRLGALASVPMGRSGAAWRSIDGRLREFQNFSYQGKGFFATVDHAPEKLDATASSPSLDGAGTTGTIGFEAAVSDSAVLGATFGYAQNNFDLGGNAGDVDYNEYALSLFGSKKFGDHWYANVMGTLAWLNYDTTRNVTIGSAVIKEKGETKAIQAGVKTQVGYNMRTGQFVHGPFAALAVESVTVSAYDEDPNGLAPLTYGDQKRSQARSRLGWQVAAETQLGGLPVRPYAQLSYDYQHLKDKRGYTVGFLGSGTAMTVDTQNETGGYGYLAVGATAKLSKDWSLGIGGTTTFSQPGVDSNYSLSVTLSSAL